MPARYYLTSFEAAVEYITTKSLEVITHSTLWDNIYYVCPFLSEKHTY